MYPILKKKNKKKIVCEEDRISNLPDEILVHILSSLRVKLVARTSILSTRWRYLWTWIPSLDFTYCTSKVIDRCLDLHRAPKLRSVKYGYNHSNTSTAETEALNRCLRYSATHSVEELFLFCSLYPKDHPASLFKCQSLMQLTLRNGKVNLPVNFCGFKSLVTLCLEQVFIKGEELCTLISTCDLLENLKVIHCSFSEKQPKISVTNSSRLRNLEIISVQDYMSPGMLEVNAPSLLFFTCKWWKLSWSDFPHLCEADLKSISFDNGWNEDLENWRRILAAITCVRRLYAGNWLFQRPKCRKHLPVPFHDHFVFKNLKTLNVYIEYKESNDYLASFISLLKASPALETACLCLLSGLERYRYIKYDKVRLWLKQIQDPIFSHDRLKTLRLVEFLSNQTELILLKFLLEKTIALESLILILGKKTTKTESELLKNELNPHKASPNAQIIIF